MRQITDMMRKVQHRWIVNIASLLSGRTRNEQCLIIDPSLVNASGHHLNAGIALQAAVEGLGYTAVTFTNRRAERSVRVLNRVRHFSSTVYQSFWQINNRKVVKSAPEVAEFIEEFESALSKFKNAPSILLFPSVAHFQIFVIGKWLQSLEQPRSPIVVLWLLFETEFQAPSEEQRKFADDQYVDAFRQIKVACERGAHVTLACETERQRDYFSRVSGLDVHLCQPPCAAHNWAPVALEAGSDDSSKHVVFAGHVSRAKGIHLLPEVIRLAWGCSPETRFSIQADLTEADPEHVHAVNELKKLGRKVRVITHRLAADKYRALLSAADIVLMPYDPNAYFSHGSGIFREATLLGAASVAPFKASFAKEGIERGFCVGFEHYSAESVSKALVDALRNVSSLRRSAIDYANSGPSASDELSAFLERACEQI